MAAKVPKASSCLSLFHLASTSSPFTLPCWMSPVLSLTPNASEMLFISVIKRIIFPIFSFCLSNFPHSFLLNRNISSSHTRVLRSGYKQFWVFLISKLEVIIYINQTGELEELSKVIMEMKGMRVCRGKNQATWARWEYPGDQYTTKWGFCFDMGLTLQITTEKVTPWAAKSVTTIAITSKQV